MARESTQERPRRRFYSPELKAQVMDQCSRDGASVAGVALSHNINPNMVHRWIREERQRALVAQAQHATAAFIPLALQEATPATNEVLTQSFKQPETSASVVSSDIRVEVRRGTGSVTVSWPLEGAASCAAWLREWLR